MNSELKGMRISSEKYLERQVDTHFLHPTIVTQSEVVGAMLLRSKSGIVAVTVHELECEEGEFEAL